jgi:hypothetical protein
MPIVDLMAISSSHFAKLKDFIQMQLPAGFPVKIGKRFFCSVPTFQIVSGGWRSVMDTFYSFRNPFVSCIEC